MALEALLGQKRQDVPRIAGTYGARGVRVFGSVARGEDDARSDLNFLVELDPGRSLPDLGGLQFELEALLGRPVDVVTERGLKARIRERVPRDLPVLKPAAVSLLERVERQP
jgi:predicted nucleotidyltransferase